MSEPQEPAQDAEDTDARAAPETQGNLLPAPDTVPSEMGAPPSTDAAVASPANDGTAPVLTPPETTQPDAPSPPTAIWSHAIGLADKGDSTTLITGVRDGKMVEVTVPANHGALYDLREMLTNLWAEVERRIGLPPKEG